MTGHEKHPSAAKKRARFSPVGATLAGEWRKRNTTLLWDAAAGRLKGEPLRHPCPIDCKAFDPDGKRLVTGSADRTARFRPVPKLVEGTPERIEAWVEVITGMMLDAAGIVHPLDAAGWQERRQRLGELGGPP